MRALPDATADVSGNRLLKEVWQELKARFRNLSDRDREWEGERGGDVRTLVPTSFVTGEGAGFVIGFED